MFRPQTGNEEAIRNSKSESYNFLHVLKPGVSVTNGSDFDGKTTFNSQLTMKISKETVELLQAL